MQKYLDSILILCEMLSLRGCSQMGTRTKRFLIVDANILIDFSKSDRTVIKLICKHVGQIFLATPVLDEISEIDHGDCAELGIVLVEPELEHLLLAGQGSGPLSFQDKLCLILAKENNWTCVTNDKPLRQKCETEGVPLIWGVELICILVECCGLPKENAKAIIVKMQMANPKYITDSIVKRAFERLGYSTKK